MLFVITTVVVSSCSGGGGVASPKPKSKPDSGSTLAVEAVVPYEPPHSMPGPATDKVYFKSFHVDRAPLDFQNGAMDLYLFSLKTQAARELRDDGGIRLDEAPATSTSIVLNPAPAPSGQLNPFSIKEVRQAIQLLVNRDFIANDIYQGMALPMVTHLSPTDFDFLTVYEQARGSDIRYDPELARDIISDAMEKAGAKLINDRWTFEGKEIRLKFIIRVEDERRSIGDLVRAELEKAGFTVAPSFQQFAPAVLSVYSSNPKSFEWHLYTEGWGRSSPQRYDFATINQMVAPWQGNMPGWREVGFWQYENQELDDLGQKLFTGRFNDQAERDVIYRRMTELALDESVRVWVATVLNSFPVSSKLQGVTSDLVSGPKGPRTLREAYIPGENELTLGHLWVWTERTTWNPIGGFGDVYSSDIVSNLYDPPVWNHPFTGLPVSNRAGFEVQTAGPLGKLDVPVDAVTWDAKEDRWEEVGSGVQATSKVVFDFSRYLGSKWHHGQPITLADAMYGIAQAYELAFDEDKFRIEFALGVTSRPLLSTFQGYRILDNNRVEVYVDFWHFEESQIASYASPASFFSPWELLAAMDDLVFQQRRAAYSDTASNRFDVPWISLVMKRDAGLVERTLMDFLDGKFIPGGVFTIGNRSLVSPEEADARYRAAIDWFETYEHLVISNGPFFLSRYDPPAQFAEIKAFRDPTYPFQPGDWHLGRAPSLDISEVVLGEVVVGRAIDVTAVVNGPGNVAVRYILLDPATSEVVTSGNADRVDKEKFVVRLSAKVTGGLSPGLYRLFLAAHSDQVATLTERRVDLELVP
ncbi:ABC transporter substrate-binding protein [Dehalococcoidia bacterium]|nr:ABC transporter substrate-binding protein [Dehalococcoidia bacterium]